ncbi:TIGR01244 family sulfur transferase [Meridianimarinicoccus sp. RP-17]|uniref:TIGR01244 family sulfur transferase n=1 Tax=Meridianimarinicoccus zhengii TaxID=2056810 RepID=UPI000DACC6C0|nr:TIGR01244 family sulfur transferase [Phycocomes zhengii]
MDIRPLTPDYAVSPQIEPADVAVIAAAGFTTLICNRPDGEVTPDLRADALRAAAAEAGLHFVENPMLPGTLDPDTLRTQAAAMADATGPVLAYCASGNRSAILWSLVRAPDLGADGVLAATRAAGYDHSPFRAAFDAAAAQG